MNTLHHRLKTKALDVFKQGILLLTSLALVATMGLAVACPVLNLYRVYTQDMPFEEYVTNSVAAIGCVIAVGILHYITVCFFSTAHCDTCTCYYGDAECEGAECECREDNKGDVDSAGDDNANSATRSDKDAE